jgi:hypothetical protein
MTDVDALKTMLTEAVAAGVVPRDFLKKIDAAAKDPRLMDTIIKELTALMGDQAEPPLNIADFYSEGDGSKYTLRWPLSSANPLPGGLQFANLDRKTQFFVLFAECQRREAEGMFALNQGNLPTAEAAFKECLERAGQIDVGELRARSLENLARLAGAGRG